MRTQTEKLLIRYTQHFRNLQNLGFEHSVLLLGQSLLVIGYCVSAITGPHADRYPHLRASVLIEPICQTSEKMQPNALLRGMQEEALCIKSRREKLPFFSSSSFFQLCVSRHRLRHSSRPLPDTISSSFHSFLFNQDMEQRRMLRVPWSLLLWSW